MIYLFVLLLRAVAYLEGPYKIASFAVVFSIMAYSTVKRSSISYTKISKVNYYILLIVIAVIIHGSFFGTLLVRDVAVLITYWIWFLFTFSFFKQKTIKESLKYILIAFLIYNVANYLFFELNFGDQRLGYNSIMALMGITGYRIYFPLSSGANVFTFQVGLNAILALYFIKNSSGKFKYFLAYAFCIFLLVLADSRLILLFTLAFSFVYYFSIKQIVKFIKSNWEFITLSIILVIFIFYKTSLFDSIKRPGELSGSALSRIDIWGYAFNAIFDDFHFLVGHGINGFENSHTDEIRRAFENDNLQTAHNFFIQNIIDFGLLGLIIILFLLYKLLVMVVKINSHIITILFVMFLLIGTTESIPTLYTFDSTIFFIALLSLIIVNNERKVNRQN
ncbi:MAG: O-antigen ligase family protein [Bacteroidia bacterium]|nr:O-antigen ligase family protein [Flaviramulus sp.]MBT8376664.1 O-antigen ligase family protein [Bacteroidia bacterium]NNC51319.1 O-antigen ligase family protein [Flaviramulus sp.]